ncbi:hypothetical protein [Faucicola boevrei]|uniref:hypothetical protein n=1 Tax=Faucicola boevrei TaxID=346665 RepID=UPI0003672CC8|nr:hypothetical protein [Moraxella boevrei]
MSGFTFSPQFSQRWYATATPIKQTIINELDDIYQVLQSETDLDNFQFRVANLHDKVEEIIAEQRRAEEQEKQRQQRERELLEQRLAQEKLEKEQLEKEKREQERLEQEKTEQNSSKQNNDDDTDTTIYVLKDSENHFSLPNVAFNPTKMLHATAKTDTNLVKDNHAENPKNGLKISSLDFDSIEKIKEEIINNLNHKIETYLLDAMANMHQDLQSWLADAVNRQLESKLTEHKTDNPRAE